MSSKTDIDDLLKQLEEFVYGDDNQENNDINKTDLNEDVDFLHSDESGESIEYVKKIDEEIDFSNSSSSLSDWDLLALEKKGTNRVGNQIIVLLENLKLESHIFNTAVELYKKALDFKKIKFKNSVMCAAVFIAFSYHGEHRDELQLISYFNTNKTKYTKALVVLKTISAETRVIKKTFTNDLFAICRDFNIMNDMDNIQMFIEVMLVSDLTPIDRISQKTIKCSLMYIWLIKNKKIIPTIDTFSNVCELSPRSIGRIVYKYRSIIETIVSPIVSSKFRAMENVLLEKKIIKKSLLLSDKKLKSLTRRIVKENVCGIV
ncbi:hypothetical protein [Dasineura jujubifolia toursvirus 2a]|nr:hypothetical protein [Dasineura jujubifolia toursvirus 2a]